MLIPLMVMIISGISKHQGIHLKYMQFSSVNYSPPPKDGKKKTNCRDKVLTLGECWAMPQQIHALGPL